MNVYHAQIAPVEEMPGHWSIYVPEIDRWTQARFAGEVSDMACDLVVCMDDDVVLEDITMIVERFDNTASISRSHSS